MNRGISTDISHATLIKNQASYNIGITEEIKGIFIFDNFRKTGYNENDHPIFDSNLPDIPDGNIMQ